MFLWRAESSLDAQLYYSGEAAKYFLNSLSEVQNQIYFRHEILDLGFIISYTLFYYFLVRRVLGSEKYLWMAFVPGFFDFLETTSILYLLKSENIPNELDWLGYLTALKWLTVTILSLILIIALRRSKSAT